MSLAMTPDAGNQSERSHEALEAARREKLRKIEALGVDPWGGRFDDYQAIGDIRRRETRNRRPTRRPPGRNMASSMAQEFVLAAASC